MTASSLPPDIRLLVHGPLTTMAHVSVLLYLRRVAPEPGTLSELAAEGQIAEPAAARKVMGDLIAAHLVARADGDRYRYSPADERRRAAVDALATMYNERPVTLIRAIYERPASSAVQAFADAFRIRDPEP